MMKIPVTKPAESMFVWVLHEYARAMWKRTDITATTKWEQVVKFGYGIQWLVTGQFASNDQGWVQQKLESWGYQNPKAA